MMPESMRENRPPIGTVRSLAGRRNWRRRMLGTLAYWDLVQRNTAERYEPSSTELAMDAAEAWELRNRAGYGGGVER